nr:N protein [Praja virus]
MPKKQSKGKSGAQDVGQLLQQVLKLSQQHPRTGARGSKQIRGRGAQPRGGGKPHFPLAQPGDARTALSASNFNPVRAAIVSALNNGAGTLTVSETGLVNFTCDVHVPPRFIKAAVAASPN